MDKHDDRLGLDSYRHIHCEQIDNHNELIHFFSKSSDRSFNIIHFNIRSYYKNFDHIIVMIEALKVTFDCIVFTEAWINHSKPLSSLSGYDLFYTQDNWNRSDGTIVYLKTKFNANVKQIKFGVTTGLQVDFYVDSRHYNLLAVYRSPSTNCDTFLTTLENYYETVNANTVYILIGDINIDILPDNYNCNVKDHYLDILYAAGLTQCIDKPTRVTEHSVTCIDHIFIKHVDYEKVTSAVFQNNATDHFAVIAKIKYSNQDLQTVHDQDRTYLDSEALKEQMRTQSWNHVLALEDVDASCSIFMNTLENIRVSSMRPKKQNSRYKKIKPWITVDLIHAIRVRDKMSKLIRKQPLNEQLKLHFNNFRNNLNSRIKKQKISYYKDKIIQHSKNPKMFWKTINEYSGSPKIKSSFPINHFCDQSTGRAVDVYDVANSFNKFFSDVGSKLAEELPLREDPPVVDDTEYRTFCEFRLEPVTESQVEKCVQEIRGGSAPGVDSIPASMIKNNIQHLIDPLKHIINLSISKGVFPDRFKTAKVMPLYKSGNRSEMNNYRPISLLSLCSKVLEKCVKMQLQMYLENNNLLSEYQFGFRKGKNTSDALFYMNKIVIQAINNNDKILMVYIDLAKAFDSIDRNILFSKLEAIGVRGVALDWFKSYLSCRRQVVDINKHMSETNNIPYGIVQGSNLGPLLFIIYINNLEKLKLTGKILMFADDTAVIFRGRSWKQVYQAATQDLCVLKRWFDQNVLTMNVNKTKCMPIALRSVSEPPVDYELVLHSCGDLASTTCHCHVIERVEQYKYLGVTIDKRLKWDKHINILKSKLRKMTYVFYQLSLILNSQQTKMVYFAYVQSTLLYGVIAWGGAMKTFLDPLFVVQKSIIKAGFKKTKRYPTDLLFRESQLLTVRQLYIKTVLVYTNAHKELLITPVTHNYTTRSALNVGIQVPRTIRSMNITNSFYSANFLYRNIPPGLRGTHITHQLYKGIVTNWLLELGVDNTESLLCSEYSLQ